MREDQRADQDQHARNLWQALSQLQSDSHVIWSRFVMRFYQMVDIQMMLDKAFQKENFSSSLLGLSSTNSNYLYLIIWLKFFNNLTKIDVNAIIIYY